jgi:hypothetical protein
MNRIFNEISQWTEVWAMLIPLGIWTFYKTDRVGLKPVILYCWAGFLLYLLADFSWKTKEHIKLPEILNDNNFIYNILSIIRVLFFSWYYISLKPSHLKNLKRTLTVLFIAFTIFNFTFLEKFKDFSNNTHAAEVIILLIFTSSYFIHILRSDEMVSTRNPSFWITTGLFIYEAINLFVFILYSNLTKSDAEFAFRLWNVHNVAELILCALMAKGLYESAKKIA